jgi:hypothetical protein
MVWHVWTNEATVDACDTTWNQKSRLELDGVRYEITAFESDDGTFRATWACSLCKENGAWVPISSDAKEVVRHAEIGVRVHHALVHGSALE